MTITFRHKQSSSLDIRNATPKLKIDYSADFNLKVFLDKNDHINDNFIEKREFQIKNLELRKIAFPNDPNDFDTFNDNLRSIFRIGSVEIISIQDRIAVN